MLLYVVRCNTEIVDVGIDEIKVTQNGVQVPLQCLTCIPQPKGHILELEESERGCDGRLGDIFWGHWDLVVRTLQIDSGENFLTVHDAGEILYVRHGVPVGNGDGIQIPVVATGSPLAVQLLDEVQRAGPAAFRRLTNSLLH